MASADEGVSFSEPRATGGCDGPVRAKPLRTSRGALLAGNSDETAAAWRPRVDRWDARAHAFKRLCDIPIPGLPGIGAIQPALWEDPRGVHALLRTACGQLYQSDAPDGARFGPAYPAGIPSNNSGVDAAALGGSVYLCLNPVSGNWAARTPLALWCSVDGAPFAPWKILEDAPPPAEER